MESVNNPKLEEASALRLLASARSEWQPQFSCFYAYKTPFYDLFCKKPQKSRWRIVPDGRTPWSSPLLSTYSIHSPLHRHRQQAETAPLEDQMAGNTQHDQAFAGEINLLEGFDLLSASDTPFQIEQLEVTHNEGENVLRAIGQLLLRLSSVMKMKSRPKMRPSTRSYCCSQALSCQRRSETL